MIIYIVCRGENSEGQSPVAVYDSYAAAVAEMARLAEECIAESYEGRKVEREDSRITVGCDVFCVETLPLLS